MLSNIDFHIVHHVTESGAFSVSTVFKVRLDIFNSKVKRINTHTFANEPFNSEDAIGRLLTPMTEEMQYNFYLVLPTRRIYTIDHFTTSAKNYIARNPDMVKQFTNIKVLHTWVSL